MLPLNPTAGPLSMAEIERLAYELTLVPDGTANALQVYGITLAELEQLKQSPLYQQASTLASKMLETDPLAAVRLIARAALPSVVASLHGVVTGLGAEDKDRTAAAKVLIDLAAPAAARTHGGVGGGGVTINLGVAVNKAVQKAWEAQ